MNIRKILKEKLKNKEDKKTELISAFPGTGKSYFNKNSEKETLDSDSSNFDKSKFPENYIEHIKKNMGKVDIIFISSHKEVRDALLKNELDFTLIYPDKKLKDEYIKRYIERGNDEGFIKLLGDNWDEWISDMEKVNGPKHIKLKSGEFLSDVIK